MSAVVPAPTAMTPWRFVAGSALLGLLYTRSLTAVVSITAAIQLVALLVFVTRHLRLRTPNRPRPAWPRSIGGADRVDR
ncbi:hypothetical protein [Nocardia sp. CA-119907]|uniref:hypothetical protein n=1 Tax=Nocardia sp. CA-119907 TaxID=3239973 RepID=UPI003D996B8B